MAYKLKFASKRALGRDYVVPPLEGLWWADDMAAYTTARDKNQWHWTMMIMTPAWLDATMSEGRCVQTLHIGPYDDEGSLLERMHSEFIPANGLQLAGRHHEVYFSDPRRTAPEKLRTLLRQPVITA